MKEKVKIPKQVLEIVTTKNVTFLLVATGVLLRCIRYFHRPYLWYDELARLDAVTKYSYAEIFRFGHNIPTFVHDPYLFLSVQKILITLLGEDLYVMRLFPFLCSLFSVWLFAKFKDWLAPSWAGILAFMLFALSPQLILFSAVFNTYSLDVAIVLLLILMFKNMLASHFDLKQGMVCALAGIVSMGFSLTSVFILSSGTIVLMLDSAIRKNKKRLYGILALSLGWFISFAGYYFYSLKYFSSDGAVIEGWSPHFMPRGGDILIRIIWTWNHMWDMFRCPADIVPIAGIFLSVMGCAAYFKRNKNQLLISLVPLIMTLSAACIHKYPFADRVIIFLLPSVYLLVGSGWYYFYSLERQQFKPVISYALLIVILFNSYIAVKNVIARTYKPQDIREVLSYAIENYQEGDVVYIFYDAVPYFDYFLKYYDIRPDMYIRGVRCPQSVKCMPDLEKIKHV